MFDIHTSMNVAGENELDLREPLLDCLCFRLCCLACVIFEVIREIPVEIKPTRIVPSLSTLTGTLNGSLQKK